MANLLSPVLNIKCIRMVQKPSHIWMLSFGWLQNQHYELSDCPNPLLQAALTAQPSPRLDLYNSELALASSPVIFWNLCVRSEIWISIVICGRAAVVGQASKALPSLFLCDSCQLRKSSISNSLPPPPHYPHSLLYLYMFREKYSLC